LVTDWINQGILLVTILRQSVRLSQWMKMAVKWLDFQNNHFFLPSIDRVMHVVFVVDTEAMEQLLLQEPCPFLSISFN
jgi:hypothetical protein